MPAATLLRARYLSTPGTVFNCPNLTSWLGSNLLTPAALFSTWIFNNYENSIVSLKQSNIKLERCNVTMTKKSSFNLRHFGHFSSSLHYSLKSHDIIFKFLDIKISWKEASDLCKEVGGYLPYFTSQHHMEEFLAFFKSSEVISPMAQIFIGLRSNASEVNSCT